MKKIALMLVVFSGIALGVFSLYLQQLTLTTVQAVETDRCITAPILVYHHISPKELAKQKGYNAINTDTEAFKTQLTYLSANGYTPITLNQLYDGLVNGATLSAKPVVITVDDGYDDAYTTLFPILQDKQVKVNLAVTPYQLGRTGFLTVDQVLAMRNSGLATVYSHSYKHTDYTTLTVQAMTKDIWLAEDFLVAKGMFDGKYFVYPQGKKNATVIKTLQTNGYVMALGLTDGHIQCKSNLMKLNRTMIGNRNLDYYGL